MKSQISLFDTDEEALDVARRKKIYNGWFNMPDEQLIKDETIARQKLFINYRYGTDLWHMCPRILHVCPQMPESINIWFQSCEGPEYWVSTRKGDPESGEHIETCPYCGAHLSDRCGDVVIYKSQRKPFSASILSECFATKIKHISEIWRTINEI